MFIVNKVKSLLHKHIFFPKKKVDPAVAYNLWAETYDEQDNNLIIYLDNAVFTHIISNTEMVGKTIVDFGCGTGSHWKEVLSRRPSKLIGYDVSQQMLLKLRHKFPNAIAYHLENNELKELAGESIDIVISTLVIGYIKNINQTFEEWNRKLKKNGEIVITDFHPVAIEKGANRSFKHLGQTIFIKNYLHKLDEIRTLAKAIGWQEVGFIERTVDESVRFFYEKLNLLQGYEDSYKTPLLYGIRFKKL